jgi:secretion/DNA translocation related TadE-like protein
MTPSAGRSAGESGAHAHAHAHADAGAGAVMAVALVAAVAIVAAAAVGLGAGLAARQRVLGAADAAALAAADVAAGVAPGDPCPTAARVAAADGARLADCTADGLVLTVRVVGAVAGIPLSAKATAGPPR